MAIKVLLLREGDSEARRQRLVREVALTATLSHCNVRGRAGAGGRVRQAGRVKNGLAGREGSGRES